MGNIHVKLFKLEQVVHEEMSFKDNLHIMKDREGTHQKKFVARLWLR